MQRLPTIEERLCWLSLHRHRQPFSPSPTVQQQQQCGGGWCGGGWCGVAAVLIFARRAAPAFITNNDDALARIEQRPKPSPSTRPRRLTCRIVATVNGARWQRRKNSHHHTSAQLPLAELLLLSCHRANRTAAWNASDLLRQVRQTAPPRLCLGVHSCIPSKSTIDGMHDGPTTTTGQGNKPTKLGSQVASQLR